MSGILLPGEFDGTDQLAQINRAHPFFDGVTACIIAIGPHSRWTRNQGFGVGSPVLNGTFSSSATDIGQAARFDGSSAYLDYGVLNIADEFTVLWGGVMDALSGVSGVVDCSDGASSGWSLFHSGTDLYLSGNHWGGDLGSFSWTAGVPFHAAAQNKFGVGAAIYRNGVKIASNAIGLAGVANPVNPFWMGRLRVSAPQYITSRLSYFYLVNKYLSAATVASIAENPLQIVESDGDFVWIPGGGAAPATFQAAWARNSNAILTGAMQ